MKTLALRWRPAGVATAAAAAAILLAARHPLAPSLASTLVLAWVAASTRWPLAWWTVVPALLPVLDASPWTGTMGWDEFDLLLLATLAGGWLRLASVSPTQPGRTLRVLLALSGVSVAAGLVRGLLDAGGVRLGTFETYDDPLNSVRVMKSLAFALLFAPLVRRGLEEDRDAALARLCRGVWIGMALVASSVFAERLAFPGLLDFSRRYRTTALFWEMHVGGAAIDVYAALGAPFVAWAVWSARPTAARLAAAVLALVWCYVCLTTFSRGVWLAVVLSLALLGSIVWRARLRRELRWRRVGDALLAAALVAEAGVVATTGSFMGERLTASDRDASGRLAHWRDGVRLLHTSTEWMLGLGGGRLPAHYAAQVPRGEFSGSVHSVTGAPGEFATFATLAGPRRVASLGGLFALTQRVPLHPGARYAAEFAARARADATLVVWMCEMHLLYARHCQRAAVRLHGSAVPAWQRVRLELRGPSLGPGPWFAPRSGVLGFSVVDPGGAVDLSDIALRAGDRPSLTRNPRFSEGFAGWFPLAQSDFLPWHIDNFALETLIERGVFGLATAAALVGCALASSLRVRRGESGGPAPFVGASLVAVLLVGAVSSVQDAPRVAFAFWLLVLIAAPSRVAKLSTTAPTDMAPTPRRGRIRRASGDIVLRPRLPPHVDST